MRDGLRRRENKTASDVGRSAQRDTRTQLAGVAGWLFRIWHRSSAPPARLALIERIVLGPKQSLALVEAEGVMVLVAISPENSPMFLRLHGPCEESGDELVDRRISRSAGICSKTNPQWELPRRFNRNMRVRVSRVSW
jgi:hypothetical protein